MTADPFRIRDHVPEFDAIVQEIGERSAATRASLPMTTVTYDEKTNLALDLFFPKSCWVPAPVHMFVHGGDYWRTPSKSDYSYVADTITAAGAIAAIIDYGSMPSVGIGVLVDQVRHAKTWLCKHISGYNCDSRRLTISGHSAGAHLAALSLVGASSGIKAALLLGGIYDLKQRQLSFLRFRAFYHR
jgi:arylformamidase